MPGAVSGVISSRACEVRRRTPKRQTASSGEAHRQELASMVALISRTANRVLKEPEALGLRLIGGANVRSRPRLCENPVRP